jgi:hypothetical protein
MVRTLLIAVFLTLATGCAKTPKTKAAKYIDSWSDMGMWLPDNEQITFFRSNLTDVRQVLISALSNPNPNARQRAAYVIGEIGPDAVGLGTALYRRLKEEPKRIVRMYLYDALAAVRFADPVVINDLKDLFQSLDGENLPPAQDHSYASADEKINVAAALFILDKSSNRREYLEYVLRWLHQPRNNMAPEQLAGYWERRWCAVISLETMLGASEAIPLLEAMLNEPNTKSWVAVHVPRVLKALKKYNKP